MNVDYSSSFTANLQRGILLREGGRFADAEKFLQAAIAANVAAPEGYYHLAFCYCNWDGREKKALPVIDQAIALDPRRAEFFALRAWILGTLEKYREAVNTAVQALALDPEELLALNARSRAHLGQHEWKEAEIWARRTLAIAARNDVAANILAIAVRKQGRLQESEMIAAELLARVPEDAASQNNAGWSALETGDYERANRHFVEALRLDPSCDTARDGLLHAFHSRVWLYRLYFRYIAWISSHTTGMQYVIFILLYVAYRVVIGAIRLGYGNRGFAWIIVVAAFYFVLLGYGRHFANSFLFLDRFARHALKPRDRNFAILAAIAYGLLVVLEGLLHAWLQMGILLIVPGCFLWAVLTPRARDAFL
jgi:tetratricopeptide (TPR) repeat protein